MKQQAKLPEKTKTERVMVNIRIRPFNEDEKKRDPSCPIDKIDWKTNTLQVKKDYDKKTFTYDKIYPMNSNQEEIFATSSVNVVDSVLKGYNGTIFAYGQTGTGKTYTMVGDFEDSVNKGIIPRSFDHIFEAIPKDKEHKYNVMVSFIQIYLETIQDWWDPKNKDIRIREDQEQGVYWEGVQWVKVTSTADCASVFHFGEKNRVTESTKMNTHSSRSHAILVVKIEKSIMWSQEKIEELAKESNETIKTERVMTKSMWYLVDLAGSERVKKTKAENMRLEEAKKINYSLLVWGNCIQSLTESKPTYVSYRDSKLTRLLQESLGGNAKTSLIVTVSPSNYNMDETISSFNFALRAMKVQNKPIINKSVDYQALCIKLQEDLDKLTDEYSLLKIDYDKWAEENQRFKNGEMFVEMQRKSIVINWPGLQEDPNCSSNKNKFDWAQDAKITGKNNKNNAISSQSPQTNQWTKEKFENEIKKWETFYQGVIQSKTDEYENIWKDIDKILIEKEHLIESLSNDNKTLKNRAVSLQESISDLEKEKEDWMKSVTDLSTKLNFEIESNKVNSQKEHKAKLEKWNNTIEVLESKIIPLENMNTLNAESLNAYVNKIDSQINELKTEKANCWQIKSNYIIKSSQNEIKIKINNDEIANINKKIPTVTEEMKKILLFRQSEANAEIKSKQNENVKIINAKDQIILKIDDIENDIKCLKQLKNEISSLGSNEITQQDKTELICASKWNLLKSVLLKSKSEKAAKKLEMNEDVIITLNSNIEELTKTNNELTKELEETKEKIMNEIKEQSGVRTEKSKAEGEIKKWMIDIKLWKQTNEKLKSDNTKVDEYIKESKSLEEKLKTKEIEFDKLLKTKDEILKIKVEKETEVLTKDKTINELKGIIDTLKWTENEHNQKIQNWETEVHNLSDDIIKKQQIINESISVNENCNIKLQQSDTEKGKKINELNTQIEERVKEINTKNNEISEWKDKTIWWEKEWVDVKERMTQLIQEQSEWMKDKEKLLSLNKKQDEQISVIKRSQNETDDSKQNAWSTIDKLNMHISQQNSIIWSKNEDMTKLQKEKINWTSDIQMYKAQINNYENIITELKGKLNDAGTEVEGYKDKYSSLNIKYQEWVENNSKQVNNLNESKSQTQEHEKEINTKWYSWHNYWVNSANSIKKYQNEIEKVQKSFDISTNQMSTWNTGELLKLIENEESISEDEEQAQHNNQSKEGSQTIITDMKDDNATDSNVKTENDISLEQCITHLTKNLKENKTKFVAWISAYYNLTQRLNKVTWDNNEMKASTLENANKTLELLSSSTAFDVQSLLHPIKIKISSWQSNQNCIDCIRISNSISHEILSKLLNINNEKDSEIAHLNDRKEYFLKEWEILKKSNDELYKNTSSSSKIQLVKYESQIKLKNEEILKMTKRLETHWQTINTSKKNIMNLTHELEETKMKLDKQNKHIETHELHSKMEKIKVTNKDINTGKFLIKEYFNKTAKFSIDLSRYCEEKSV